MFFKAVADLGEGPRGARTPLLILGKKRKNYREESAIKVRKEGREASRANKSNYLPPL